MSLLDDARKMASQGASIIVDFDTSGEPYIDGDPYATAHWMCVFCSARQAFVDDAPFVHRTDCPWLSMSKIVAALEAAQALARSPEILVEIDISVFECQGCDGRWDHAPGCVVAAFLVVYSGDSA